MTVFDRWAAGTTAYSKSVENRLRRVAERQGLVMRKNRRKDRRAIDYGVWYLERNDAEGVTVLVESHDLRDHAAYLGELT